jgi:hypothetical protein
MLKQIQVDLDHIPANGERLEFWLVLPPAFGGGDKSLHAFGHLRKHNFATTGPNDLEPSMISVISRVLAISCSFWPLYLVCGKWI